MSILSTNCQFYSTLSSSDSSQTLVLFRSLKIMRLFDVRPLRAVMRGVDCSGHMKALQSIWTMQDRDTAEVC